MLTKLIEFFEEITKVIEVGRKVDFVDMDFRKPCDNVSFGGMIQTNKIHGIHNDLGVELGLPLSEKTEGNGGRMSS